MTTAPTHAPALTLEAKNKSAQVTISGTDSGWDRFLGFWERCYRFTLEWLGAHPVLAVITLAALLLWRWQASQTKVALAAQKTEYQKARAAAKASPQKGRGRR